MPLATDVWKDPYAVDVQRGDTERTTSGIFVAWDDIFGAQLTANATLAVNDGDSNIDFYDTSLWMVSVGMLYRFD